MDDDTRTTLGGRLLTVVALGTLAAATAIGFSRVFTEGALGTLLAAALLATAVGVALERRGLALATAAAGGVLLLAIGWLVFPATLWFGLPTAATIEAVGTALREVGPQAREQISPTVPSAPLVLASLTAVYAACFSAHALAVRAASPALALAPSVALLAFSDSALRGVGSIPTAALFLIGALLLFLADGVRRIREWGPLRTRHGSGLAGRGLLLRGAGGAAAMTLTVAVLLPGILPFYGGAALVDVRSPVSGDADLNPLVSIGDSLNRSESIALFRVQSSAPLYWRLLALDQFDGETWRGADLQAFSGVEFEAGEGITAAGTDSTAAEITQSYEVMSDLGFSWIPAAFAPKRITIGDDPFRFDPDLATAVAQEPLQAGDRYEVVSAPSTPTPDELRADSAPATAEIENTFTQLPENLPAEVGRLASEWTAGAATPYDKAIAIQERLQSTEFRYDISVEPRADDQAIVRFLTVSKRGFCQQFAGSMAVMLRTLGIPARIAVGFTEGLLIAPDRYEVGTDDAHAWVEVFFPNYGWLAFEPTQSRTNTAAASYLAPAAVACDGPQCETTGRSAANPDTPRGGGAGAGRRRGQDADPIGVPDQVEPLESPWRRVVFPLVAVIVVVLLLGALLVPPAKAIRRRAHLRSTHDPRGQILATFSVFSERAADLGIERKRGETLDEYGRRLTLISTSEPAEASPALQLTGLTAEAAYGANPVSGSAGHGRTSGGPGRDRVDPSPSGTIAPTVACVRPRSAGRADRSGCLGVDVGRCIPQRPDEPSSIGPELAHVGLHAGHDLVDGHEEGELPLSQGVEDLAVPPADLEYADPVRHELDLGQVLIESGRSVQVVPGATHALQRHPPVEQRLDHLQRDQIAERVQARNSRTTSGALHRGLDQSDLIPIPKLPRRTAGELAGLMSRESFRRHAPPSNRSPSASRGCNIVTGASGKGQPSSVTHPWGRRRCLYRRPSGCDKPTRHE